MQILLHHRCRLRLILVIEMFLVHQYHVVVRHRDFRQPGVIGACQINFLERQTQPDGNRRNQYVVRTGHTPTLANTQLQNPCTPSIGVVL